MTATWFGRTEEAGIHAVEIDVLLTPGVEVSLEHASGVVHVEDGEFGVGAEEGRGNGADIHAGGAEDGYCHAEGAFAVAAHVVDGRDARDVRAFALIKLGHDSVSFPRTYGPAYGYRVAPVAAGAIAQLETGTNCAPCVGVGPLAVLGASESEGKMLQLVPVPN